MMKTDDLSPTASRLRMLDTVPSRVLERIAACGKLRWFADGTLISQAGDRISELHVILSGAIRSTSLGRDGREHVVGLIEPGNFCGLFGVLDNLPNPHSHIAQGETEVLAFSAAQTQALIDEEPDFRQAILMLFCARLRGSLALLDEYVLCTPMERLARRLIALARHYGLPTREGLRLDLALSQDELGAMIGLSRQSTNKLLRTLESHDILHFRYGQILIMDLARLKDIAEPG